MNDLNRRAFIGLFQLMITLAASLFLSAWTVRYWQAWTFLGVFFLATLAITGYLMGHDPELLARRVNAGPRAEHARSQKVIQALAGMAFLSLFILSAVDHRLGWSRVPRAVVATGDLLVALGLYIVFLVFKENTFTSAIIEVGAEQKTVSTGPYAVIRHPMYAGALVMLVGVPLSLGSWWGLFPVFLMVLVIVWRLLDEEGMLATNLTGYAAYLQRVRYRLVPFVW